MSADAPPLDPARLPILQIERQRIVPNPCRIYGCGGRWRCAGARRLRRRDSREWPPARRCPARAASLARSSSSASDSTLKRPNAGAQSFANLFPRFAHAGKNDGLGLRSGALQAKQFADRDDVESAAQPRQQAQDGEIGVGFDRIADRMRLRAEAPGRARDRRR